MNTLSLIEVRIAEALKKEFVLGSRFSRLVRQLKIVSRHTGETIEQVVARLRNV